MARVRIKNEWKMWAVIAVIFLLIVGYLYLASRPPTENGEYLWRVMKVTGDKDLHLEGSGKHIVLRLIGMNIPPSEAHAATEYLTKDLDNKWIRIKILRKDPKGVKEGLVYVSNEDIVAQMIRKGLATVDRSERAAGFDVRSYIELEQEAKREQEGLWRKAGSGAQ
jgi:endonuclease YncB( thermonuclease family)